jgi:hypothetical protein
MRLDRLQDIKEKDELDEKIEADRKPASPAKYKKGEHKNAFTQKGLTDKDKERMYLEKYDENIQLLSKQSHLEQHIKE